MWTKESESWVVPFHSFDSRGFFFSIPDTLSLSLYLSLSPFLVCLKFAPKSVKGSNSGTAEMKTIKHNTSSSTIFEQFIQSSSRHSCRASTLASFIHSFSICFSPFFSSVHLIESILRFQFISILIQTFFFLEQKPGTPRHLHVRCMCERVFSFFFYHSISPVSQALFLLLLFHSIRRTTAQST